MEIFGGLVGLLMITTHGYIPDAALAAGPNISIDSDSWIRHAVPIGIGCVMVFLLVWLYSTAWELRTRGVFEELGD